MKTYVRSAYRKIGVTRRPQAVGWAITNGFKPDTLRTIDLALLVRPTSLGSLPAESWSTALKAHLRRARRGLGPAS